MLSRGWRWHFFFSPHIRFYRIALNILTNKSEPLKYVQKQALPIIFIYIILICPFCDNENNLCLSNNPFLLYFEWLPSSMHFRYPPPPWINFLPGQTSIFGVVFFASKSLWELRDKRSLKNLQFWPESLGVMLEYWYIERGLLHFALVWWSSLRVSTLSRHWKFLSSGPTFIVRDAILSHDFRVEFCRTTWRQRYIEVRISW